MKKEPSQAGFGIIEIMVVCVIIGILAAVMVPRFIGTQDRARIGAAVADLDQLRRALGMYEVDYLSYPASSYNSVDALVAILIDERGIAYMTLPDGTNFGSFAYQFDSGASPSSYTITVTALDQSHTTLVCSPEGINRQ